MVGPNDWLVNKVPFTEGEVSFSATNPSEEVADYLNTTEGIAIFTVERMTWLKGQNITFARLHFARDYKMTTRF